MAFVGSFLGSALKPQVGSSLYGGRNVSTRTSRRAVGIVRMVAAPPKEDAAVHSDISPMTLTRFMNDESSKNLDMAHLQDLQNIMTGIQVACKKISSLVSRAGITNLTGLEEGGGSMNIQGEEQKKLDVLSNDVLKNALRFSGKMGVIASEEEDEPVVVDETTSGNYVAVFDPLDGSSNIDAAVATGTIFGIFAEDGNEPCLISDNEGDLDDQKAICLVQTMQPGKNLVAAGYCMYSSSCMMVITTGKGVNGFTLDPQIGEFVLTHPNMQIPKRGKIYSFNEANYFDWDPVLRKYVDSLKDGSNRSGNKYSSRYIGSLVADVHRTLLYGGIFGYPADRKNKSGKLRLLYECAPMSFLLEQAGGLSTTGTERVLDIKPNAVHQRLPLILGSAEDVQELMDAYSASS